MLRITDSIINSLRKLADGGVIDARIQHGGQHRGEVGNHAEGALVHTLGVVRVHQNGVRHRNAVLLEEIEGETISSCDISRKGLQNLQQRVVRGLHIVRMMAVEHHLRFAQESKNRNVSGILVTNNHVEARILQGNHKSQVHRSNNGKEYIKSVEHRSGQKVPMRDDLQRA